MSNAALTSSFWYLSRGTGVVTLLLLTLVVALGIATRSGRPLPGLPRFAVAAVHRSASLLTLVFLGIHVTTLLFDKYAQLKLLDLVVPFAGSYRPLWLGLGTIASDLLLALVATSLLRHRLGPRGWRAIHWTAYAAWPVALLHGLGTGTDAGQTWLRATAALSTITVAAAVTWRCSESFSRTLPPRYPSSRYPSPRYPSSPSPSPRYPSSPYPSRHGPDQPGGPLPPSGYSRQTAGELGTPRPVQETSR